MKDGLPLKFRFFSKMFKISVIILVKSTSESCITFICVVCVWILLLYYSLRFSVYSTFIVISACSSLSNTFLKSKSGSRIKERYDALILIAFF